MQRKSVPLGGRIGLGIIVFGILTAVILTRSPKWLSDFDQSFYLTIAYDLSHHGVFSNGIFDDVNSTTAIPPPGMFLGPLYPWLILGAAKLDPRFAKAVDCSVEANHKVRDGDECEVYATPMHLLHAVLLSLGVLAIAIAGEIIFGSARVFWLSGILATLALIPDADLFSFIMTESLTFCLYSLMMLALVMGWNSANRWYFLLAGIALGLLCLARPSFQVLALALPILIAVGAHFVRQSDRSSAWPSVLAFTLAFLIVVGPWIARNYLVVGKLALSEEYGTATLVERFAFNRMTVREFLLAFPYCIPQIGPSLIRHVAGPEAMARFRWDESGSFFAAGRQRREALLAEHARLDPIAGELVRDELRENWWSYLLVSVPLAWCGLWVGGPLSLVLVPLFVWGCIEAIRRGRPLLLLYATPAFLMLALHAAVANHYTRYNLILIGPFAAASTWLIARVASRKQWTRDASACG